MFPILMYLLFPQKTPKTKRLTVSNKSTSVKARLPRSSRWNQTKDDLELNGKAKSASTLSSASSHPSKTIATKSQTTIANSHTHHTTTISSSQRSHSHSHSRSRAHSHHSTHHRHRDVGAHRHRGRKRSRSRSNSRSDTAKRRHH